MRNGKRVVAILPALALAALASLSPAPVLADAGLAGQQPAPSASKDTGPSSAVCDSHRKDSPGWSACIGAASAAMAPDELFYAGYWLAKTGAYAKALGFLEIADQRDPRVVTYRGFATRKLGDVDRALPLYARALDLDPDYVVARAYLGEAMLSKGDPAAARRELAEIERRCGAACPAYGELAGQIAAYDAGTWKG